MKFVLVAPFIANKVRGTTIRHVSANRILIGADKRAEIHVVLVQPQDAMAETLDRIVINRAAFKGVATPQSNTASDAKPSLPPLTLHDTEASRATIALEPALMTFLDGLKRRKFLTEWENALIQD